MNYRSTNGQFGAALVANPCKKGVNTQLEITFNPIKGANQYLFLQWYQGYGESLLEYDRYVSMVRAGISMRLPFGNLF